jgi:hypothetical protein
MMTRFATALLALAAPVALAAEVQFVPLQDYIGQAGVEKDPALYRSHHPGTRRDRRRTATTARWALGHAAGNGAAAAGL